LTPRLSITIVDGSSQDMLRNCLLSLYTGATDVEFDVIVVDNATRNGCVEMLAEEFPQATVLENDFRRGFAANQNQAIRICTGGYILLLNDDTIVKPGALQAMCDFLDRHAKVGAVGCRLENPNGTLQKSCYRFPSPERSIAENLLLTAAFPNNPWWGDYRAWAHDEARSVDFVSGAALMVRREVVETVGLLDEDFFLYAEETDWCRRIRKSGWQVAFTPAGTIVHYGGQSSAGIEDRKFCEFTRNQMRYIKKHHGVSGAVVYRLSMLLGAVIRILIWGAASPFAAKHRSTVSLWWRILKWHLGLGPNQGIRELAAQNRQ
jgi:GT2 family glycosyltransferase